MDTIKSKRIYKSGGIGSSVTNILVQGIEEWDDFFAYVPGETYFVYWENNIWKFIGPDAASELLPPTDPWAYVGIEPGTNPAVWEIASIGQLTHEQNTDYKLADKTFTITDANLTTYYTAGTKTLDLTGLVGYNIILFSQTSGIEIDYIRRVGEKHLIFLYFGQDGNQINNTTGSFGFGTLSGSDLTLDEGDWVLVRSMSLDNNEIMSSKLSGGSGGALSSVSHDESLNGNGTASDPLSVLPTGIDLTENYALIGDATNKASEIEVIDYNTSRLGENGSGQLDIILTENSYLKGDGNGFAEEKTAAEILSEDFSTDRFQTASGKSDLKLTENKVWKGNASNIPEEIDIIQIFDLYTQKNISSDGLMSLTDLDGTTSITSIPAGYCIDSIVIKETSSNNAGNISIGTAASGTQIVNAQTVNADDEVFCTLGTRFFSTTSTQSIYISSSSWGSGVVTVKIFIRRAW